MKPTMDTYFAVFDKRQIILVRARDYGDARDKIELELYIAGEVDTSPLSPINRINDADEEFGVIFDIEDL